MNYSRTKAWSFISVLAITGTLGSRASATDEVNVTIKAHVPQELIVAAQELFNAAKKVNNMASVAEEVITDKATIAQALKLYALRSELSGAAQKLLAAAANFYIGKELKNSEKPISTATTTLYKHFQEALKRNGFKCPVYMDGILPYLNEALTEEEAKKIVATATDYQTLIEDAIPSIIAKTQLAGHLAKVTEHYRSDVNKAA